MAEHYSMNKQREAHMNKGEEHKGGGEGEHPHSIHIHHASSGAPHPGNPHHVHIHHADGSHEHSDHANFQEAMQHAQEKGGGDGGDEQGPEGFHDEQAGAEPEGYGL